MSPQVPQKGLLGTRKGQVLLAIVALGVLVAIALLAPKLASTVEHLIQELAKSLGQWAYLLVGFLAMAETAAFLGFIAPGEFAIIIGGVLAGEGSLSIQVLIGVVWVSIVIGDSIGFLIGRKLGRGFIERNAERFPWALKHFGRVEQFFRDHGGKSIFLGRWIGFARPLMPFTAGTSGMPYRRFLPYDILGAGTWGTFFCLVGYIFWRNFDEVTKLASRGALALGVIVFTIAGIVLLIRRLRDPATRARWKLWIDRQAERPLLRPPAAVARLFYRVFVNPIWHVARPWVRFTIKRLTPGELGIELTTLLAIAAVCGYIIFLQIDLLNEDPLIRGDMTAIDISQEIQHSALTWLARSVSLLGAFLFVTLLVIGVTGYLLGQKRRVEAVMLVSAFFVTEIATHIIKVAEGRDRPEGALVDAAGGSYPSGHASLSVTYVAIGVLLARSASNASRRIAWIVAGFAIGFLIGSSRVYLRVHYLSDVVGGWALGFLVFSLFGAIALIVDYLVRNGAQSMPRRDGMPTR